MRGNVMDWQSLSTHGNALCHGVAMTSSMSFAMGKIMWHHAKNAMRVCVKL